MSSFSKDLLDTNDDVIRTLIPAYIYMAIIMLLGILGNLFVIYFYGIKRKTSQHTIFIVVLAGFDLFTCTVAMPLELYDLVRFYTYENTELCKITRFCTYFGSIASATTLLVIAVDRYRMLCKPFKRQISPKIAKILFLISSVVGASLSIPAFVFYEVDKVNLTRYAEVAVYDCTINRDEKYKLAITLYDIILFIQFTGSFVVLFVLYALVARQLFKMKRKNFSSTSQNVKSKTFTAVMICVTAAYILSFVPYLTLATWRSFAKEYEPNVFSCKELILYRIGLRSYFLSSAVNPIIYGFFNEDFRTLVLSLFCFCLRWENVQCFKLSSKTNNGNEKQLNCQMFRCSIISK